ncbi:NAD(P)H-hydrate dehydratase [Roseibacillus ishigakijimensis]|uniref:Bifunctional NAD(P)H-hydrate repair enzyme n=1 Tax=Roseibacillus ishigakijimensis TaxID=454146 RepID=A0A934RL92_9BACT|nr:NAD(P)H-hydrate dehydratase [Roseibacillus ishigakijimensis]MBK1833474.1 NAD(P)H-hydrate dehydratase [Roseibacillus ishigakijimensis]
MITCGEMKRVEEEAFATGATAEGLMEKVAFRMARVLLREFSQPGRVVVYMGKGHNAGDALVVARHLRSQGWQVELRSPFASDQLSKLTRQKKEELGVTSEAPSLRDGPLLLLDGLVGIGAKGALRGPIACLAREMNELRRSSGALTIAMDIPSGLDGDTGEGGEVIADHTLTVGIPKRGLVADGASHFVGRLHLIPVEELALPERGDGLITPESLRPHFPPRSFDFHKGQAGRVSLLAGGPGTWGAAVLCAQGALRAGAGLITLWVEKEALPTLLPLVDPEVMIRPRPRDWGDIPGDALVIGPGLGQGEEVAQSLQNFLVTNRRPTVLDADALNLVAAKGWHEELGANYLLTPHPGEMKRLWSGEGTRAERASALAEKTGATVLLKGSRTVVTRPDADVFYNTTGHPGMATGGQGDTLSGVLGALLAGGREPLVAARAGAWLCGRAAELALCRRERALSLTPSEVARHLGPAFCDLWQSRTK